MSESLVKEGTLMRDALLRDLNALKQYQLIALHDVRLVPSKYAEKNMAVAAGEFKKVFKKALKQADLVWLIAPETDGTLLELTEQCLTAEEKENDALLLGCGFDATLTGTSKSLSFEAMQATHIFTLPVYAGEDLMQSDCYDTLNQQNISQWVAKPEDGAGCEGIQVFDSLHDLKLWITEDNRYLNYLAQPYQAGVAASFSMLCRDGKSWLLSCNQQHITFDGSQFKLTGITVNGMLLYWQRFETIARKIAKMLPDALGYVGVDVIVDVENNDKIYVLEINPRLTTSYVGLHEALNYNPAKLILDCVLNDKFEMPVLTRKQVEIQL
ncbi:MAG: ATP-grasp domain-containing protein [Methylotenera sp.]|nr:ATP-grasp domain-containing protein [Methylotenera sp.]MDO9233539.1 ATP-grasp domain-containing protein [Methylotenera sp.]MDO9387972.1 ATP-grasp domain-containing protein [Methylotenera sp.]MDP2103112.1 ATP-grasp domain-containing protein [Methylotenera sp.]MDP2280071.1 ATP-grasp domain-containing protein [Methylotenera sp.]